MDTGAGLPPEREADYRGQLAPRCPGPADPRPRAGKGRRALSAPVVGEGTGLNVWSPLPWLGGLGERTRRAEYETFRLSQGVFERVLIAVAP